MSTLVILDRLPNARIDITKAATLITRGEYTCSFTIVLTGMEGSEIRIPVYINLNVPLTVNGTGNNGTLTINLNQSNNYTELLTIIRDREWTLENVDTGKINVSPANGNGQDLPGFSSTLTVTRSPDLSSTTATAAFQIVSLFQRVNVIVNITITATLEFVDPLPNEAGVTGTENLYLYL